MKTSRSDLTDSALWPQPWVLEATKIAVAALKRAGLTVAHFARTHNVTTYKIRRCQRRVDGSAFREIKRTNHCCRSASKVPIRHKRYSHGQYFK